MTASDSVAGGGERTPGFGHRLESLGLVCVGALARLLPERVSQWMGAGLGRLAGSVLRIRRGTVERNLARAFPDWSEAQRRRLAAAAYRHLGREAVALLRLGAMDRQTLIERTDVHGEEYLRAALERGKGAVLLLGHMGNWEVAAAALAVRGHPIDAVGRRQSNPLFDRRIRTMREGFGMRVLYRDAATRPLLRGLRDGRVALLAADQNIKIGGIFVDFFGTPAAAVRGPGVLPLRTGAPAVFAAARRLPGSRARYRVDLHPVPIPETGDLEADVRTVVQGFHRLLEASIRTAPEQYFWFHRRWKTRPDPETREARATEVEGMEAEASGPGSAESGAGGAPG